jgi:hypothetical protein
MVQVKLKHLMVQRVYSSNRLDVSEVEFDDFGLVYVLRLGPGKKPQNIT